MKARLNGIHTVCAIVAKLGKASLSRIAEQTTIKPKAIGNYCARSVERGALIRKDGVFTVTVNWQELAKPRWGQRPPLPPEKRKGGRPRKEVDEKRVKALRAEGCTRKEIGECLSVSERIVARVLNEPVVPRLLRPKQELDDMEDDNEPLRTLTRHRGVLPKVSSVWELGAMARQQL